LETLVPSELIDALKKQKYHFVGKHSAVKRCRWLYETLIHNRPCYKQKFYGIKTHQCIQMTPAAFYCTQQLHILLASPKHGSPNIME
jgi:tRNA wybutosine-synthesizing protein 1